VKAAILTPAYSHADHRLERAVMASGLPWLPAYEHSDLPRIRSVLIEEGLRAGAERLILVDADTVPSTEVLRALAEADGVTPYCAVWGMYPLREGDRWSVNPLDGVEADRAVQEGRSFPIATGGLGLCAIHRESLLRVADTLPTVTEAEGLTWRPFCLPFVEESEGRTTYYADDGSLCARLYETGTELWCDPRLRAGHVVRQVVTTLRG
jgi:hypothetical protein